MQEISDNMLNFLSSAYSRNTHDQVLLAGQFVWQTQFNSVQLNVQLDDCAAGNPDVS